MIKHPFNKSWYDKYDNVAKDTLVTYLKGVGHDVGEVKEDYNVDVVSTKKDFTYFNEAEVKRAWKGDWPCEAVVSLFHDGCCPRPCAASALG